MNYKNIIIFLLMVLIGSSIVFANSISLSTEATNKTIDKTLVNFLLNTSELSEYRFCNLTRFNTDNMSETYKLNNRTRTISRLSDYIMYYDFNENFVNHGIGGSSYDLTHNGDIYNSSGIISGGMNWNSTNPSFFNASYPDVHEQFSVSLWVKPELTGLAPLLIYDSSGSRDWYIYLTSTQVAFTIDNGSTSTYFVPHSTNNTWTHIGFTYNNVTRQACGYVNGSQQFCMSVRLVNGFGQKIYVGGYGGNRFNGDMDEIKLYNYTLTSSEINQLYERKAYYFLDSNSSIENEWGPNLNGTVFGMPYETSGRLNRQTSLFFDGIDDYVRTNFNNNNSENVTMSVWFKPEIINKGTGSGSKGIFDGVRIGLLWDNTTKRLQGYVYNGGGYTNLFSSTNSVTPGNWYHATLTRKGRNLSLYLNGIYINSISSDFVGNINEFNIGRTQHSGGRYFNGSISEAMILNRALNGSEIISYMNNNDSLKVWDVNDSTLNPLDEKNYTYKMVCEYDWLGVTQTLQSNLSFSIDSDIDNCTTYTMRTYNFTTRYIEDNSLTNSTIEGYFWVYGTNESQANYYNLTWENGNSYGLCVFPNTSIKNLSANIYYYNDDETRTYYLRGVTISNVTQNLNLYFQNQTSQILFYVIDENDDDVSNAFITVRRHDIGTNTDTTLYILKTDDEGSAVANVMLNTQWYSFTITYQGEIVFESEPTLILTSPKTFRINLGTDFYDTYNQVLDVVGSVSFVNATKTFSFTYNDLSGSSTNGCLEITKKLGSIETLVNKSCLTTSSGTINLKINSVGTATFIGQGYVKIDGVQYVIDQASYTYNERYKDWGEEGVFATFFFLTTITMVGVSMASPPIAIALLAIGVVLSISMSIFMLSWEYAITFIILAGIAIYFSARKTR